MITIHLYTWIKYIPFVIIALAFVWIAYKIITTDHLLDFVKKSLCDEKGKPSGKSIAGFACINCMLIGFFVSIYYAEDHVPPEWYVETLAFLIGCFYGFKEVGKFAKNGQSPSIIENQSNTQSTTIDAVQGNTTVSETTLNENK
jgi:hypothetical protein